MTTLKRELTVLRLFGDLSIEYDDAVQSDMIDAYQANADHDYFDLVGMWIGGGQL